MKPSASTTDPLAELRLWVTVFILAAAFFVGMEWLFFATKPSFLNVFVFGGVVRVFGATLLPLIAGGTFLLAMCSVVARIPVPFLGGACRASMHALPTLVLSASALLLLDNFTTTVLGWGIASLRGGRLPYAAGVLAGVVFVWWEIRRAAAWLRLDDAASRVARMFAVGFVAMAGVGAAIEIMAVPAVSQARGRPARLPNILMVGMDGVNADHLSVYGYGRPTTPALTGLALDALVFTNAYSNAGNTGAALTAILTGRLPTDTRVVFAPDVLRGDAAVLHLPGLLRALGYRTGQFAVRHFGASTDFNLRGGFDVVNDRVVAPDSLTSRALQAFGFGGYFMEQIAERLRSRVEALAGHREHSAFAEVTGSLAAEYMDGNRLRQLREFIVGAREPWFAHAHLLGTHGAQFTPRIRRFSAGQAQVSDWMADFYDDAILEADTSIGELLALLRRRELMDRTLIVIYSDHAQASRTDRPVPLLVRMPDGSRHERVGQTVQSIDIAPTIVDALGLRPPDWMVGQSLLRVIPPCRRVFGALAAARVRALRADYTIPVPPFFSLGAISLVQGQQWFELGLNPSTPIISGAIPPLPDALGSCEPLVPASARAAIVEHLNARGYQVPRSISRAK